MFYLNQQEMSSLIKLINGEDYSALDTDIPQRLFNLTVSVQRAILNHDKKMRNANDALNDKLEKYREKNRKPIETGNFPCLELDSTEIANAIVFCLQAIKRRYTKFTVMCLTYQCYASWLYHNMEKLTIESPVANPHGPWFWRVSEHVDIFGIMTNSTLENLRNKKPGLDVFVRNVTNKYAKYSDDDLMKNLKSSEPYLNAHKDKNDGKWNKPLEASDIYRHQEKIHKRN